MRKVIVVLASVLATYISFSQIPMGGGGRTGNRPQMNGSFYGKLIETKSGKPIEYASVQLIQNRYDSVSKKRKDVVVAGMLTKANGEFNLENIPVFGQFKLI